MGALDKEALKRHLPPIAVVDANNVEDHLIARLENDLTPEQVKALGIYLFHHPEYQRAERTYALTKLVPEAMAFAAKQHLHRSLPPEGMPAHHTLDDFLVARLEGDLSPAQEEAITTIVRANKDAQRSWELMQATRVQASTIVHPDKSSLKKGGRVIAIGSTIPARLPGQAWIVRLAAAASVALLVGMAWWWWARPGVVEQHMVDVKTSSSRSDGKETPAAQQEVPKKDAVQPAAARASEEQPPKIPSSRPGGKDSAPNEQNAPLRDLAPSHQQPLPTASQAPLPEEAPLPIAEQAPVAPSPEEPAPQQAVPSNTPTAAHEPMALAPLRGANDEVNTAGQAFAGALRERVLDRPARAVEPLDGDDAVALVDRGLKAVAGDRAGLQVARDAKGRGARFQLRLGRHVAISASR